jgi:flagellin
MGLRINTNVASLSAQRNLSKASQALSRSFGRLSSGLRIARASDDAAGLAISERMRAQIRSLQQAQRNANDGISLVQTAEGALEEINGILIRLRELAVESATGTMSATDRTTLDAEFQDLVDEIDRIATSSKFNGTSLLTGAATISVRVGSGTNSTVDSIGIATATVLASSLTLSSSNISSASGADTAISSIDAAINQVSSVRGTFGAASNRLEASIRDLGASIENLAAAESRIRDVDVAAETANLTKTSIMQQAAISVLAQANVQPQSALTLLQG